MLSLVDSVDVPLKLIAAIGDLHLDIIDILGYSLDAQQVGLVDGVVRSFPSILLNIFVISRQFLYFGESVYVTSKLLVRSRSSFFLRVSDDSFLAIV